MAYELFMLDDQPVKVWEAQVIASDNTNQIPGTLLKADKTGIYIVTGEGILNITKLQPSGKKTYGISRFPKFQKRLVYPWENHSIMILPLEITIFQGVLFSRQYYSSLAANI